MALQRIPVLSENTKNRQTNKIQANAALAVKGVNALLGNVQVIEAGDAPGDAYSANNPTWNSPIDTFITTVFVDSATVRATVQANLKAGDRILIFGRCWFSVAAGNTLSLCLALNDGGSVIVFPRSYFNWGAATSPIAEFSIVGCYTLKNAMGPKACALRVRGARTAGTGAVSLMSTSGFSYVVLR